MNKRDLTCCFTGHRNIGKKNYSQMKNRLYKEIEKLIADGYLYFGVGGALGFDTEVALAILNLKSAYPKIKLILVLPYLEQAKGWPKQDIEIYEDIKNKSDKIVYTSEHYHRGCYYKRNRHLVDNSSICIAYLTKKEGGTAYTVEYAQEKNVRVINIATKTEGRDNEQ